MSGSQAPNGAKPNKQSDDTTSTGSAWGQYTVNSSESGYDAQDYPVMSATNRDNQFTSSDLGQNYHGGWQNYQGGHPSQGNWQYQAGQQQQQDNQMHSGHGTAAFNFASAQQYQQQHGDNTAGYNQWHMQAFFGDDDSYAADNYGAARGDASGSHGADDCPNAEYKEHKRNERRRRRERNAAFKDIGLKCSTNASYHKNLHGHS